MVIYSFAHTIGPYSTKIYRAFKKIEKSDVFFTVKYALKMITIKMARFIFLSTQSKKI